MKKIKKKLVKKIYGSKIFYLLLHHDSRKRLLTKAERNPNKEEGLSFSPFSWLGSQKIL